jgi:GST-like protein
MMPYVVYGRKGTGSVPVEATLLLLGEPYEAVERGPGEDRPADNPLQQVPVLGLPDGQLMTESDPDPSRRQPSGGPHGARA